MNRLSLYIRQSLQSIYSPQELKSLTRTICCDLLGVDAIDFFLGKDIHLSENKQKELETILKRLRNNEPIQYIRGYADFFGLMFSVAPGVLIPRPETEELVDLIIKENAGALRILDIGTGSGCIAITLAKKIPLATVSAWDISEEALAIARQNNSQLGTSVSFCREDIFDVIAKTEFYDIIVSNPPYITSLEKEEMDANVLDWEPELALFVPDDDPLYFYRSIGRFGMESLPLGGKIYFEINQAYGDKVSFLLKTIGYRDICVIKDLFGKDRIIKACK
ncbi:peptide chain release factor N(5)-glutamine methyltransferase [uncultured Bacteroides sp.]|uniref:peptide chain release factor N(5)-glutamine methyltransferase n=1 Tax=uncultured Bacteroides sp. TaxID=162156 RepID=UPI002AA5FEF4|nr:peptide chain release factor N(5)-glutamine methyltransferase [uncultured Bacteroides sp.]